MPVILRLRCQYSSSLAVDAMGLLQEFGNVTERKFVG
jgi:hypothetical protein